MTELRRLLINLTVVSAPLTAVAQVDTAIVARQSPLPSLTPMAWDNPSLISHKYDSSLSTVEVGWRSDGRERYGEFEADTYLRRKNLTLTARAAYDNGKARNLRAAENVDAAKLYPYFVYDAVGGDMSLERYQFGGSVDVDVAERWSIGVAASYDAGLYYRNVDPRPKDITGQLDLTVGAAYRIATGYSIAAAAGYEKYKQSCDISFVSELGESTVYHLTGLGNHYGRFAGTGKSSYYTGNAFLARLTLYPSVSGGFYLSAEASTERIAKILIDLNRLPLCRLNNRRFAAEGGWRTSSWGVTAFGSTDLRHGYENIFGDAVTGQYPQIASLGMSSVRIGEWGLRGACEWRLRRSTLLSVDACVADYSFDERNRATSARMKFSNLTALLSATVSAVIGNDYIATIRGGYGATFARNCRFDALAAAESDLAPFVDALGVVYSRLSRFHSSFNARAGLWRTIASGRYALGLSGGYQRRPDATGCWGVNLEFKF